MSNPTSPINPKNSANPKNYTIPNSFLSLTIHSNANHNHTTNNNPHNPFDFAHSSSTNPNSNTNQITFNITKAYIKESLSSLFEIHCEGYIENLSSHPFSEFNANNVFNGNNAFNAHSTNKYSNLNSPHKNNITNNPNNHLNNQINYPSNQTHTNNNPHNINFHPNSLIDSLAMFSITNPYPNNNALSFANDLDSALDSTLDSATLHSNQFNNSHISLNTNNSKTYMGIIKNVQYLGLNAQSSDNILNRANTTNKHNTNITNNNNTANNTKYNDIHNINNNGNGNYNNNISNSLQNPNNKHFFNFSITSPLFRASLNKAYRIYTNKTPIEAIKATLRFYENLLHKNLDFSHISFPYQKAELITQYNESDLDFIFRIAHNNGIYFYEDSNTIYFYDFIANKIHSTNTIAQDSNNPQLPPQQNPNTKNNPNTHIPTILFNTNTNNTNNIPCINSLYKSQVLFTKSFTQSTHCANNPYELHSLSSHFNANPNNNGDESNNLNDSNHISNTSNNDLIYNSHIYNSQYSFNNQNNTNDSNHISNNINTTLNIATSRANMLNNIFEAQSNIYDLCLNQRFRIKLEHSSSTKQQNLQDFYIIANTQMLINESLLANNINTNDNIIKKSNAFFNTVLFNNQTNALQNPFTQDNFNQTNTSQMNLNQTNTLDSPQNTNNIDSSQHLDSLNLLTSPMPLIINPTHSKSYFNTLTLLPINISFTPHSKAKPLSPLTTLGIVIGEQNDITKELNTIHTDNFGRVRVRINAFANQAIIDNKILQLHNTQDSSTQSNESKTLKDSNKSNLTSNKSKNFIDSSNSNKNNESNLKDNAQNSTQDNTQYYSPYLRVASPIASNNAGFYHTPRVGDEVLISFLDNDIDKPYISGSLYNNTNTPNLNLPKDSHKTSISSKTLGLNEKGINEITLENIKDNELISIHAQKDYDELIEHNFNQNIKNNKESTIKGHYKEHISKIHTQNIDLAKIVKVGAEYNTNVALSKDTIVGTSNTLIVGLDNKLKVTQNSSEYVGGDKEVIIKGSVDSKIEGDKSSEVMGDRQEIIKGDKHEEIEGNLHILSQSQGNIYTKNGLYVESQTLSFQAKDITNIDSDSLGINAKSSIIATAENDIIHQVGDTTITAKGDCVIIKAGGVEVVIDSNGLVVKGGEIKSE